MTNLIHPLDTSGLTLPTKLNNPFDYQPHELCQRAWQRILTWPIINNVESDFYRELCRGKMIGVLVVADNEQHVGFIAAFSGQIAGRFDHEGFVPAVFDYLGEGSLFRQSEGQIALYDEQIQLLTSQIEQIRLSEYAPLLAETNTMIAAAEQKMRTAKAHRQQQRASGHIDSDTEAAMIRESQFLKAELRRCRQRTKAMLQPIEERIDRAQRQHDSTVRLRHELSETTQRWLFDHTVLTNAQGDRLPVNSIFAQSVGKTPPSGAGECCAPKLLNYAFCHHLRPIAIAEYWFGASPQGEIRHHGCSYPACRSKCWPLLPWMLQGVETEKTNSEAHYSTPDIVYENHDFCIVRKPAGLLSVPGKDSSPSMQSLLQTHYGAERDVRMAHRLDQATSGLMIATFGDEAYKQIQALFAQQKIEKTYIALLESDPCEQGLPSEGDITLPLMPDIDDRPRQKVSPMGSPATTHYHIVGHNGQHTRVEFHPHTGRTHQLRVHAASPLGLNSPIVGDKIYGNNDKNAPRLMLHAAKIRFCYPDQQHPYQFEWQPEF